MTHLRDRTTHPATFRTLAHQIGLMLALQATRDLDTEEKPIETPLEPVAGRVLTHQPLTVVAILRSGVCMIQPFVDLFPDVSVGYLGLERDHATALPRSYYAKLPPLGDRRIFLVDPMLATGGSACQALATLEQAGAGRIVLVSIVAAPEGVAAVEARHPGVDIHVAALDRELNRTKYILPGLGDFGDRLYGT